MKPSQFLYSESVKDQKVRPVNTKSIPDLKPLPQSAGTQQKDSLIYSLVSLPVKEGQEETIILPQSMQGYKVDPKKVIGKNTEIARSLKKLKPIDVSDSTNTPDSEKVKPNKTEPSQLQGPKLQVFLKKLNDLTNGLFKKTQSQLLFGSVEQKIQKNTILCVIRVQELKFFNEYNQKNHKIPSLFCWEAVYKKKSLAKTTPKDFKGAQQDLIDFVYNRNNYDVVDIILWKIKNNDEKYIGQFELSTNDFRNIKEILDYKQKIISETLIEKEIYKSMKQTKSFLGNVRFQLIQLGHESIAQGIDKHSGIPGSPRTDEEKLRHRIIDQAMGGMEYRWFIDDQDRLVIEVINAISQETDAIHTIEEVQNVLGEKEILMMSMYADYEATGRFRPTKRTMRKEHFEQVMSILKELDANGVLSEVQGNLRKTALKGRITRKNIQDALQSAGCSANELLLFLQDDMGNTLMDFLLMEDDLPSVLEAMNELNLIGEDDLNIEHISENLFKNIGRHLRNNSGLKKVIEFIKALHKKPEIGVLIQNYSYSPENMLAEEPPFLQNFEPMNYEHVMVLSKLNKLIQTIGIDTKFTQKLKQAHIDSKKAIYFDIPCFPKDKDLKKKKDSLELQGLGQNVMHELVRRQKWAKTHLIFENYSEWFFVQDNQDKTPFQQMLTTASFETIKQLFTAYPDQIKARFENFDANQQKPENKRNAFNFWRSLDYKMNYIHSLLYNQDPSQTELLDVLRLIEQTVNISNPDNFDSLKRQRNRADDFSPVSLYLETIRSKCKLKLDRIQREIGTIIFICQMLLPEMQGAEDSDQVSESGQKFINDNKQVIAKILAKMPEQILQRLEETFKFINWIPKFEELSTIRYINLPHRELIKQKQNNKLYQLLQQMNEEIKAQEYNPADQESQHNKTILYYFQIQLFMFIDIKNLRSTKLDQVSNQILLQLKEWTVLYTETLIMKQPMNLIDSHYGMKEKSVTFLNLLNFVKFNLLINDLPPQSLNKLDPTLLKQSLSDCHDLENIQEIVKVALQKDPSEGILLAIRANLPEFYKAEEKEQLTKDRPDPKKRPVDHKISEATFFVVNQHLFEEEIQPSLFDILEYKEVRTLINTQKIDQILQLTLKMKSTRIVKPKVPKDRWSSKEEQPVDPNEQKGTFVSLCHQIIINNWRSGKNVGLTHVQAATWLQTNQKQIPEFQILRYLDYFRQINASTSINMLINLEIKSKRIYPNNSKIENYIFAQGKSWFTLLEFKKYTQTLKDILPFIDIEDVALGLSVNGFIEKLEVTLPFIKNPKFIRMAINTTAQAAACQISDPNLYLQFAKFGSLDIIVQNKDNFLGYEEKELAEGEEKVEDLRRFLIKSFDPSVFYFKTNIKFQPQKIQSQIPKFPENLESIRVPPSTNLQLKEMSGTIEEDNIQFRKANYPKAARCKQNQIDLAAQEDIRQFNFIKNWRSSFLKQNLKCVFTPFERPIQSYKKTLTLLLKQYQRYGQPLCDKEEEFHFTLQTMLIYNLMTIDQILFQLNKLPNRNMFILQMIRMMLQEQKKEKIFMHYYSKNQSNYVANISKLLKAYTPNINAEKEALSIIMEVISENLQRNQMKQDSVIYKLSLDTFIKLEQLLDKDILEVDITNVLTQLNKCKNKDKSIQTFLLKYFDKDSVEVRRKRISRQGQVWKDKIETLNDQKDLQQLLQGLLSRNVKQIVQMIKKINKMNVILEQIPLVGFMSFINNDKACDEIFTELFKLPVEKGFKQQLLEMFNKSLFEGLIAHRMRKSYNTLIHNIWIKQLLNQNVKLAKDALISFTDTLFNPVGDVKKKEEEQNGEEQVENDQGEQQVEVVQNQSENHIDGDDNQEMTLAEYAAGFKFFEFFETLVRLQMKANYKSDMFESGFLKLCNEESLKQQIQQYEQNGFPYLASALRMYKYLMITFQTQCPKEMEIFLVALPTIDSNSNLRFANQSPQLKLLKDIWSVNQGTSKFWLSIIDNHFESIKSFKLYNIDRGIRLYHVSQDENFKPEDWRKLTIYKPSISVDAYMELMKPDDKLYAQILNDKEFQDILVKYYQRLTNRELCLDTYEFYEDQFHTKTTSHTLCYLTLNFPSAFHNEVICQNVSNVIYADFQLSLVYFRSILQVEPKVLDRGLEIYFNTLSKYYYDAEGEEAEKQPEEDEMEEVEYEEEEEVEVDEPIENQNQDPDNKDISISSRKKTPPVVEEEEEEEVEMEVTDNEAEEDQFQVADAIQQKKTKTVKVKRKKEKPIQIEQVEQAEPKKIMKKIMVKKTKMVKKVKQEICALEQNISENSTVIIKLYIYLEMLLLAISNDEAIRNLQKYLIQYKFIPPLQQPKEIDQVRKNRMLKDGFKEPFDKKFVEQIEAKFKDLKASQLEDFKHIKEVITFNEQLKNTQFSDLFQLLLKQIHQVESSEQQFERIIQQLQDSIPYKLINKRKSNVFQVTFDKEERFFIEIRNYFRNQNINISSDFMINYFNATQSNTLAISDKWIQTLQFLKYCIGLIEQISQFEQALQQLQEQKQKDMVESDKYKYKIDIIYKCKQSTNFEPLIYEHKKQLIDLNTEAHLLIDPKSYNHQFIVEVTVNILKSNSTQSSTPVAYINSKYCDEIYKVIDSEYFDFSIRTMIEGVDTSPFLIKSLSHNELDRVDLSMLLKFINKDNFRQIEDVHYNFYFIDETIDPYLKETQNVLPQMREHIASQLNQDLQEAIIINEQEYFLFSDKIRPDIKLQYLDKFYPVPYSNYVARNRSTLYKQSLQNDLTFPELFPLTNIQAYTYLPDIFTKEQYNAKFDILSIIQQSCFDLNSYTGALSDFLDQLPEDDEYGHLRMQISPQIVQWPLLQKKDNTYKHVPEAHPFYMISYLREKMQLTLPRIEIKYHFNTLSFAETILYKLGRIMQQTTNKKCKINTLVNLLDDWTLLKKILVKVADYLTDNGYAQFKFYYVEINEVHQNQTFQMKSNKLEGLDSIFRFGQTQFYVHSNVLIVRLNVAIISESASQLIVHKNAKLRNYESSNLLMREDKELRSYMNSIVTLEEMLKQIFTKK